MIRQQSPTVSFPGWRSPLPNETFTQQRDQTAAPPLAGDWAGHRGHFPGQFRVGSRQIGPSRLHDGGVELEAVVHQQGEGSPIDEFAGIQVEGQVDPAAMNPVVARLGAEHVVHHPGRLVLVGVAREINVDALGSREHRPHGVGIVVVEPPAHVADHNHGVDLFTPHLPNRGGQRLHRVERCRPAERFR